MAGVKGDGTAEGVEGAGDFFVWVEGGESDAEMVIDGDMEALDAGAWIALGTVTGGADAGLVKWPSFLMSRWRSSGRFWRFEGSQAVKAVAAQDAGEGGLGDGQHHADLGIGTALAAQGGSPKFRRAARPPGSPSHRPQSPRGARPGGGCGAADGGGRVRAAWTGRTGSTRRDFRAR